MADWPHLSMRNGGPILSSLNGPLLDYMQATSGGVATSNNWPANNRAVFMPVYVDVPVTVTAIGCIVSGQSGNLDMGIYDIFGNRLVSSGSTAVGTVGPQLVTIASTPLSIGIWYLALACSTTLAAFQRTAGAGTTDLQVCGVQEANNSLPLPQTATFIVPTGTAYGLHLLAFTNALSVF